VPIVQLALALAQFAPQIMRYFGAGEASAVVAGTVVDIASSVTGSKDPQEILSKLNGSAELAQQFQLACLAADADLEKRFLADRQDARGRDVEVRKLSGGKNTRADLMVLLAVVGIIACLVVLSMYRKEIPGEVVGILGTVIGIFGACLRDAYQFEFGSSRGSKAKDEQNANLVNDLLAKVKKA
jgi:hypothetical protein